MNNNKKKIDLKRIAESLINSLNKHNLGAFLYHSATTGSVYIRFADPKLCSIRIGDHNGRDKYNYKWNLRSDLQKDSWRREDNVWRYYCPCHRQDLLIAEILKRKEITKDWETKFEYKTPSFKKLEEK